MISKNLKKITFCLIKWRKFLSEAFSFDLSFSVEELTIQITVLITVNGDDLCSFQLTVVR